MTTTDRNKPIFMVAFKAWLLPLGVVLLSAACSSGGGGDGGGGTPPVATTSTGTIVDSPVNGLGYRALPSGVSGITKNGGRFEYQPGDTVTFNIYGRVIGTAVPATSVVTVLSVFNATSMTDPRVLNLSQLLLGLGGIPAGTSPITLPAAVPPTLPPMLDFASLTFDADLLNAGIQLVSEPKAIAHLQANFSTLSVTLVGSGSVTSNPTGISCGATCSADFSKGTAVTLTPTGAGFTGWSDDCTRTGACVVTLNANASVTATFTTVPVNANLTVTTAGNGTGTVMSNLPGITCGPTCTAQFLQGTVDLTANAASDSTFAGWSNVPGNASCTGTGPCSIPLTIDSTVTATFTLNAVPVSVTANIASGNGGGGAVQCSANGGAPGACGSYPVGATMTLTANPNSVSNFTGWSGAMCSGTGTCIFWLTANTSVTANFNRPTLSVVVAGTGTVTSNPPGINCGTTCTAFLDKGTPITLTATGAGSTSWSGGGCSGNATTCLVTLTTDATVTALFSASTGFVYPLRVDPTARHLVDQNGKPFLLVGDAAWSLFAALSDSDADFYLANRQQLGFTAVIANLIEHQFAANPPANFYGNRPFTGETFTTPNEAYFAHVDYIIQSAAAKGIVVFLDPLYLGFNCGSEGWCAEVQAATTLQMTAWGQYVGNRYQNFKNIIWVIGADTDPTQVKPNVQAMVNGILSVDTRHPFTAHNASDEMAITPWSGAAWLTVNDVYTHSTALYQSVLNAYSLNPTIPVFLIESAYENEHGVTSQQLRAQSYWTVLSGGFGHIFGNCPIWGFGFTTSQFCASTDWKAQLNNVGSVNMQHFGALFNSRHWQTLVPDTSQTILTAGSGPLGGPDYATAACAADGSSIIAYLPSARTVSVNMGACLLNGSTMTAWWYDPSNGATTLMGTSPTTGTQDFTPPLTSGDWVLVLDSTNFSFPSPGQ